MSNRIKQLRAELGLTQWQLAELVNATPQQISHLERSKRQLTQGWMNRLSEALRCRPADLLPQAPSRPATGTDEAREAALLALFRALPAAEQDVFLKIGNAIAGPDTTSKQPRRSSE